jgi:hypothetical protein
VRMLANAAVVGSMFGATTLSGSVVCGSQLSACSFHHWFGNFGGTGFPVLLALKNTHLGDALVAPG